jgi:hypothetical protein
MKKSEVYDLWATPAGAWTQWVKPLLFAHLEDECEPQPLGPLPEWIGPNVIEPLEQDERGGPRNPHPYRRSHQLDDVAAVVDLPGAEGTLVGVALARHGFRPIPLYSAIPGKFPVVDQAPIMKVLVNAAPHLADVPKGALPAFLLDANRMGPDFPPGSGTFDNRSVCFPTDFPSARTLREAGIRRAVLIQAGRDRPANDLVDTLVGWQKQGIAFFVARTDQPGKAQPRTLTRDSWLRRLFHALERWEFHRDDRGAFGKFIEVRRPSAG